MYTERHFLDTLPPHLLDLYLEKGWYRMGQTVFTCRFLIFASTLYSVLWVRLSIPEFTFSKSQRKLFRKLEKVYSWEFGTGSINAEKEAIYQRYRKHFKGRIAPSLAISLQDDGLHNIFDTWEVRIREKSSGRLVAYSFFDRGRTGLASILGVYEPSLAAHSLGYFTMLLEMQFGIDCGYSFYYPGYVAPGYPKFDYKLRLGPVSYYQEQHKTWVQGEPLSITPLPHQILYSKLKELQTLFSNASVRSKIFIYPPYEANILGYWVIDYLEYPLFLEIYFDTDFSHRLLVVYDHTMNKYRLLLCSDYEDLSSFFDNPARESIHQPKSEMRLLIKEAVLAQYGTADEVLKFVRDNNSTLKS